MPRVRTWLIIVAVLAAVAIIVALRTFVTILGPADDQRRARNNSVTNNDARPAHDPGSSGSWTTSDEQSDTGHAASGSSADETEPRHVIKGLVLSPDAEPVADATVMMGTSTSTDEDGRFAFEGISPGKRTLVVDHEDYVPTIERNVKPMRADTGRETVIVLREGGRIAGSVTDGSGRPVRAARVRFEPHDPVPRMEEELTGDTEPINRLSIASDPDGAFTSFALPAGPYTVKVLAERDGLEAGPPVEAEVRVGETVDDVNLTLVGACSIAGRVVDPGGQPVPGASVYAFADQERDREMLQRAATASDDGSFVLTAIPSGKLLVLAHSEGFDVQPQVVNAPATDVVLALMPKPRIVGRVIDAQTREPVAEFTVRLHDDMSGFGGGVPEKTMSDPEGRFTVYVDDAGENLISVVAPGYAEAFVPNARALIGRDPDELLVELERGATVHFVVTSAADGAPVAQACVIARRESDRPGLRYSGWAGCVGLQADEHGRATLTDIRTTDAVFDVAHAGYLTESLVVEFAEGELERTVEVALEPAVDISGRVVSRLDGNPIEGASVKSTALPFRHVLRQIMTTDEDGSFTVEGFEGRQCLLSISHDQYATASVTLQLPLGSSEPLLIELGPRGRIVGTVTTADDKPVEGAKVTVRRCLDTDMRSSLGVDSVMVVGSAHQYQESDSESGYEIQDVEPGLCQVVASSSAGTMAKTVFVHEGGEARADFVLSGAALYGVVTLDGKPADWLSVRVRSDATSFDGADGSFGGDETDSAGAYRIENLAPGDYTVLFHNSGADVPGFAARPELGPDALAARRVRIATDDVELNVALGADGVSGSVLLPNGWPAAGAAVQLDPAPDDVPRTAALMAACHRSDMSVRCDDGGTFHFESAPPGTYRLRVSCEGYATHVQTVEKRADAELAGLTVQLEAEARTFAQVHVEDGRTPDAVTFHVYDLDGHPVTVHQAHPDPTSGRACLGGLSPGEYTVVTHAPGYARCRTHLTVVDGAETVFPVELARGRVLGVEVRASSGEPVADARVVLDPGGSVAQAADSIGMQPACHTRPNGVAALNALADGTYTVLVQRDGYGDAAVPVTITDTDQTVEVTLHKRCE